MSCYLSFQELQVQLPSDVAQHILSMYQAHYRALLVQDGGLSGNEITVIEQARAHVERWTRALKTPPSTTVVRINQFDHYQHESLELSTKNMIESLSQLVQEWIRSSQLGDDNANTPEYPSAQQAAMIRVHVERHSLLPDVASIRIVQEPSFPTQMGGNSLAYCSDEEEFQSGESRRRQQHPSTRRKRVICDRRCGEAVLRGSDIFVRGILCADSAIRAGDDVEVYADLNLSPSFPSGATPPRGLNVDKYQGRAVYLGRGVASCPRSDFFRLEKGIAVRMSVLDRVGPILPPLPQIPGGGMLQNLPSVLVGHVLQPHLNDFILDMCAAPGGKTLHLASLVRNRATIVACDRSRSKMVAAKALFAQHGATSITPVAVDSTRLVAASCSETSQPVSQVRVEEILSGAKSDEDGLLDIKEFPCESFDRILLDPPCSALGLRPKLCVPLNLRSLKSFASYQRKLVAVAVKLLKPGGTMTYSTCTINILENERMVRHILDAYPAMKLGRIDLPLGSAGLAGSGLNDVERSCVRRFDPADDTIDTIGFFLAKFHKELA